MHVYIVLCSPEYFTVLLWEFVYFSVSIFCFFFPFLCICHYLRMTTLCYYGRPALVGDCLHWQPAIVVIMAYCILEIAMHLVNKLSLSLSDSVTQAITYVVPQWYKIVIQLKFTRKSQSYVAHRMAPISINSRLG